MKPIEIVWSLRTRMSKKTADELFFFFYRKMSVNEYAQETY